MKLQIVIVLAIAGLSVTAAYADDWTATQLLGPVQEQVGGQWNTIVRGTVIPDGTVIRTLAGGRVTLVRGTETVQLSANTQLVIKDEGGAKPFTTIAQASGTVSIEADIRNVQHFAVDTSYLAAVVKGTRFMVTTSAKGSSVQVTRGHVEVEALQTHDKATLSVGQLATVAVATGLQLDVSGQGKLPTITGANGKALGVTEKGAKGNAYGLAKQAARSGSDAGEDDGDGGNGNGGNGSGNGGNGGGNGKSGGKNH